MALGLLSLLAPLLAAGASGLGSFLGSRGSRGPQPGGVNALGGLDQQATFTDVPGGGKFGQFQQLTPEQQDLQKQLISLLSGQLGEPGKDPIAEQARTEFRERGLPELLERFTAQGSALRGSGTREALLRAQTGLESQLAGRKYQTLQNLLGPALSPTTDQLYMPEKPGGIGGLLKGLSATVGATAPIFAAQYGIGRGGL